MSEQELTDLQGLDWDIDGGYWYSVANGDVSPERLLAHAIQLEGLLESTHNVMVQRGERAIVLEEENAALSELLSHLVDVELERDTLADKLRNIECAECGLTMLECKCDET